VRRAGLLLLLGLVAAVPALPAEPLVTSAEWQVWRAAFLTEDGRVVDTANGGISHSEGQGYGLLLAVLAGRPDDFDAILGFTRTELLIRDDGLAAWRWHPGATPHVTDLNAASDGDILIAYALDAAGTAWGRDDYAAAAADLARAIGAHEVADAGGRPLLLPAPAGFAADDRPDGPVVNLSYWVFEALPVLARLDPATEWGAVGAEGLRLAETTRLGPQGLPPDWLSLKTLAPADGFPPEYGYNALRLPLYLVRAGLGSPALLERLRTPAIVDLATGRATPLDDPGFRAIGALVACRLDGTPLPPELATFAPTDYYPSTLHLLVLAEARREMPSCL
jgi:endo-1,4-beta-D-glucanase Y